MISEALAATWGYGDIQAQHVANVHAWIHSPTTAGVDVLCLCYHRCPRELNVKYKEHDELALSLTGELSSHQPWDNGL